VLDDATGFGAGGTAYVSLETARSMFAQVPYVSTITLLASSEDTVDSVQSAVDTLLRQRAGLDAERRVPGRLAPRPLGSAGDRQEPSRARGR